MYRRGSKLWLPVTLALIGVLVSSTAAALARPCTAACSARGSDCHQSPPPGQKARALQAAGPTAAAHAGGCHGAASAAQQASSHGGAAQEQRLPSVSSADCCAGAESADCAPLARLVQRESTITSHRDSIASAAVEPARVAVTLPPPRPATTLSPPPIIHSTAPPTRTVVLLL